MSLAGKNILFFSPEFFGYAKAITAELLRLGANVDAYDTRPDNTTLTKIGLRIAPFLLVNRTHTYHQEILERCQKKYDYVFVIRGEGISLSILKAYKKTFPEAKFVYYTYDALSENRLTLEFKPFFDLLASFDPVDCAAHPFLQYEPLFYIPKYAAVANPPFETRAYDVSSIGTFRLDRYETMKRIDEILEPNLKRYYFHYHPSQLIFNTFKLFSKAYREVNPAILHFQSLSSAAVADVLTESKAVIDVQKSHQRGLTMRTIEMLGSNRKLITTNSQVKTHDFYNPNNICVVNPLEPVIPTNFFSTPYQNPVFETREKYSLASWLERLLS